MLKQTKTKQRSIGDRGERRVAWYLRLRGYRILARNWTYHHKEVDIIAARGRVVAFVEVKTRLGRSHSAPQTAVTSAKINNIVAASRGYALLNDVSGKTIRFDVAEVTDKGVNYIKSAFHG